MSAAGENRPGQAARRRHAASEEAPLSVEAAILGLITVRVADLHAVRESPADAEPPDPRYPSPTFLRRVLSFVIDLVLHLGVASAVAYLLMAGGTDGLTAIWVFVATWFGTSVLHRVVVQWLCQTTLGKWVAGLRVIRVADGGRPALWDLVRAWWSGLRIAFGLLNAS